MIKIFLEVHSGDISSEKLSILTSHYEVIPVAAGKESDLSKNQLKKKVSQFKEANPSESVFYYLIEDKHRWELIDSELNYLAINFDEDALNYKRKSQGKKELFFKALGSKTKKVLDLTCGLGIDAIFLARNGYMVECVERNPLVYFLLSQAAMLSNDKLVKQIFFNLAEAKSFVEANAARLNEFDAIYFDPMYPDKSKTALSRQEMQLFKGLIGKDEDANQVLELIRNKGPRVVVKRPIHGQPLDVKIKQDFIGKTVRYDIY